MLFWKQCLNNLKKQALVNQCVLCMMSLGDDKIQCVTLSYETDSDCSSSISSNEEECTLQNAGREVAYAGS